MELEYIGHSAIALNINGSEVLVDPFINGNPTANYDYRIHNITDILLTHGHSDHLGDAIEISKAKNAIITATFELSNYCYDKGANTNGANLGGKLHFEWGDAWLVPARHSSSTPEGNYAGEAAGIVFNINGLKIYHAGDTSLTEEMKLIKDIYKPEIALLPIGGCFTMGIEEAVIASQILGVKKVIPIHYNTFPLIKADASIFKYQLETYGIEALIMKPGEKITL